AGAVGADQTKDLPRFERKGNAVERDDAAEPQSYVPHLKQVGTAHPSPHWYCADPAAPTFSSQAKAATRPGQNRPSSPTLIGMVSRRAQSWRRLMAATNASADPRRAAEFAIATVDNPPVNALKHEVRAGLVQALDRARQDDAVEAVVVACAGRTFFAGADI